MNLLFAALAMTMAFSLTATAAQDYDREYAYVKLLDMGYDVPIEAMGEMFKHGIFILSDEWICSDLGATAWDDSHTSCLLQVKDTGEIGGFESNNPNALYE